MNNQTSRNLKSQNPRVKVIKIKLDNYEQHGHIKHWCYRASDRKFFVKDYWNKERCWSLTETEIFLYGMSSAHAHIMETWEEWEPY